MQETTELFDKVRNVIERDIRPYIESDGGSIHLRSIKNGIVYVQLAGACAGCPGAAMTLKGGVERVLRAKIPEVQSVELAI